MCFSVCLCVAAFSGICCYFSVFSCSVVQKKTPLCLCPKATQELHIWQPFAHEFSLSGHNLVCTLTKGQSLKHTAITSVWLNVFTHTVSSHVGTVCMCYSVNACVCVCLHASAAATVWSWAFAVWFHCDVWEIFGWASSPRSIAKIRLMTTWASLASLDQPRLVWRSSASLF